MVRLATFLAVALASTGAFLPSGAQASAISKSMGNLRWGMSQSDVERMLERKIKSDYAAKMKKASSARKASLKREMQSALRQVDGGYVEFRGRSSRWDRSSIATEYTYGNGEGMIVQRDGNSTNYYFFIDGQLWKWVKTFDASVFGGRNFKKFQSSINKKFGKGHAKEQSLSSIDDTPYKFIEYLDRNSRMRAVDKTDQHGEFALIFEDMGTVRSLSSLRSNTTRTNAPRRAKRSSSSSSDYVASPTPKSVPIQSRSKNRKSLFNDDGRDESQSEYEKRKKATLAKQRRKQEAIHNRNEDRKKAKVLDDLAGIDDDDPLAGMH